MESCKAGRATSHHRVITIIIMNQTGGRTAPCPEADLTARTIFLEGCQRTLLQGWGNRIALRTLAATCC